MDNRLLIEGLRTPRVGPLDLALRPGECLAVSGPSGSGKSLLLRAIAELDPCEGELWLDGKARREFTAPAWRREVGLLPTESQWWGDRVSDHFEKADPAWLDELLCGLDLERQVLDMPISRLSSGERQRLAIARLLTHQPKVLLLDEPTVSLDARNVLRVESVVARERSQRSAAVVWVTHTAEQIQRVAGRTLVIEAGKAPRITT